MKLNTEQYKGYSIKFLERILGKKKLVVGEFTSKITGRYLGVHAASKDSALSKVKMMIDKEVKVKGLK
jgi:hypothetical protein